MLELDNLFDTHIITCIKFCYCALLSKFFFLTQNVHATIDIIIAGILEFFLCIYATILDPLLKRHVNLLASIVFVHRLVRFECYM